MKTELRTIRGGRTAVLLALFSCFVVLALIPKAAEAEETHFFNATLSLTGDCTTSALDPVPDPSCPTELPGGALLKHSAVAIDAYGDRYVLSRGGEDGGPEARIDIFDSSGHFLKELAIPGAETLAVDATGHLYVGRGTANDADRLLRYAPTAYSPDSGEIEYAAPPVPILNPNTTDGKWDQTGLAINMTNNHLFVVSKIRVAEFGSAAEGNPFVDGFGNSGGVILDDEAYSIAIDPARGRIYVSDAREEVGAFLSEVKIIELAEPHQVIGTIDGSTSPYGAFTGTSTSKFLPVAVDEETGHVFIGDLKASTNRVYEFEPDGTFVSAIEHSFKLTGAEIIQIAVDNGPTSPTRGYLFVPSGSTLPGHSYAFEPKQAVGQPVVETLLVSGVTEDEAILRGKVNPAGSATSYRFEYTTEQRFLAEGFTGSVVAGSGALKAGGEGIAVRSAATGLAPDTSYRFRLVAESAGGKGEAEMSFTTFGPQLISNDCPNQGLRTSLSATLPDCRAYELVTPTNTGGHLPVGQETIGAVFPVRLASRAGDVISFMTAGGAIPGTDAPGSAFGDRYLMTRSSAGWSIESAAPSPDVSSSTTPYGGSLDQRYSVYEVSGADNPAAIDGKQTFYLRYPDGHSEVLAQGSLGIDPVAIPMFITENGTHIIIRSSSGGARLEPDAAPVGTNTIYDRTPDGVTHVVSLLPGEVPQKAGEGAEYLGASLDGRGVAFSIADKLYLRRDNAQTYEVASGAQFVGVTEGGGRAFFVAAGQVRAFDAEAGTVIPFTPPSAQATVVNVSADGTAVYFVSPKRLTAEGNPQGDKPHAGEQNLYLSREGAISFVGTVTEVDVAGEPGINGSRIHGLGLWTVAFEDRWQGSFAFDPSRSTPDGTTLLFESRAPLTADAGGGQRQIYRYDDVAETLRCLSCNPTGALGGGDATLEDDQLGEQLLTPVNTVYNLRDDGDRAFFETTDQLVLADVDGLNDVYEWEEQGVGSCLTAGGCIYLISSGSSGGNDYLYAVSDSGDDVFFRSGDLLLPEDIDATPSIYDARVGGGFPPPQAPAGECLGEACQPAAVAPNDPTPASSAFHGQGNVVKQRCPKGKHTVRKGKRTRCVRKHKHHKPKRASAKRRSHR